MGTNEPEPIFLAIYEISKLCSLHFVLKRSLIILRKETVRFFQDCSLKLEKKKVVQWTPLSPNHFLRGTRVRTDMILEERTIDYCGLNVYLVMIITLRCDDYCCVISGLSAMTELGDNSFLAS